MKLVFVIIIFFGLKIATVSVPYLMHTQHKDSLQPQFKQRFCIFPKRLPIIETMIDGAFFHLSELAMIKQFVFKILCF